MLKSMFTVLLGVLMFGVLWVDPIKAGEAVVTFFQAILDFVVYVAKNINLPERNSAVVMLPILGAGAFKKLRLDLAKTNQESR